MPSESCLGTPWGPSYEHICKNIYFLERLYWLRPMVKKSANNCIEGCSQSTTRLNVSQRCEEIIVISYYDIMIV